MLFFKLQKSNCGFSFSRNNFNLRGCAEVAATGGTKRAHHFTHVEGMLLLPDSTYITWAPRIPRCLPSQFAHTHTFVRNQRTSEFSFAESKCADTGTTNRGILLRSVRNVPVCFATSHKAAWVSEGDCSYRRKNITWRQRWPWKFTSSE